MLPDLSLLVALFLGLSSASTGPVDGVRAVAGTVAATLAGVALSWLSAERVIRLVKNPEDGRRRRVVRLSGVWPLVAWIAAVEGFDWVTWVVDTFPRTTWLLPYVVLFLPVAVLWSAEWAAQGRIASALSPGGAARGAPGPWASVRRGLARNGLFLAPLPIVVGVLQGIWLLGHWGVPGMREASQWFEAMPILGLATAIVVLALVSFALPGALRRLLSTTSMPAGPTRALLERQATAIGLRYRDIVVWRTHGRMLNAMVVGFTPGTRTIFVTDGLLNHLPEEEVLAVFSHEAGHAMKRHLPLFLLLFASTALAFGVLDAVFEAWGLPEELGLGVYLLFIWFVLLGVVARFFEREADVYGADHAADLEPSPESLWVPGLAAPIPAGATRMIRALERVRLVAGEGRSHTHGTISQRVAYVAAWATDPEVRERFQRRRRGLHRLFAAGVLLAVLVTAVRVPTELAVARGVVAFDRGIEAATALEARLPVRRPEDAARWREALDDFDEAARSLAGRGDDAPRGIVSSRSRTGPTRACTGSGTSRARGTTSTRRSTRSSGATSSPTRWPCSCSRSAWTSAGRSRKRATSSVRAPSSRRRARSATTRGPGATPTGTRGWRSSRPPSTPPPAVSRRRDTGSRRRCSRPGRATPPSGRSSARTPGGSWSASRPGGADAGRTPLERGEKARRGA